MSWKDSFDLLWRPSQLQLQAAEDRRIKKEKKGELHAKLEEEEGSTVGCQK